MYAIITYITKKYYSIIRYQNYSIGRKVSSILYFRSSEFSSCFKLKSKWEKIRWGGLFIPGNSKRDIFRPEKDDMMNKCVKFFLQRGRN